ncbi:molybdopterin-dependent oxidoreductase [Myxococcota bacterium]|nr:molybdopterin-dependent oxidoreductase [Myxococcota bacterium]
MPETHYSFCRFCHASCAIKVTVEDGRAVSVIGDKDNPVYHGYTCAKGRALPEQHANPERLMHSMKRQSDGSHAAIPVAQAMDEIAAKVQDILDRHGPRSVALYTGTFSFPYPASTPLAAAWLQAMGSPMHFTSATIDQPGKMVAPALLGRWEGGPHPFDDSDTWLLVGANPTISKSIGIPCTNPARHLHQATQRGMKLIIIDPRRTEAARAAHVHLQPRPGEDPTILAGMIRVILDENRVDQAFIDENVQGMEALRKAVAPFTPEYVERRADVPAHDLITAARTFADAERGCANVGTGPNMAPRGNLTEYLCLVLATICGRWLREGERIPNPGVLMAPAFARAQASPPVPGWGFGEKMRVRGLSDTACGLPTAALADEILLPGDGQVKALFSLGGNPMAAWPDQVKTHAAMEALELNVTVDIKMSATAKLADYVIAPKLSLETEGMTLPCESLTPYVMGYPVPYAQYTPAIVEAPEGSDLIEDWEFFYGLGQRMGHQLRVAAAYSWGPDNEAPEITELDMVQKPSNDDLFDYLTRGSRIPLAEVKQYPRGQIFEDSDAVVRPRDPSCEARLDVANSVMVDELAEVSTEPLERDDEYRFRLVSRRLPDVHNSAGRDIPKLVRKYPYNPAFMHESDLRALEVEPGEVVAIHSRYGSILGVVEIENDIRPGVISMPHAFGDAPGDENDARVRQIGSNTGKLSSVEQEFDPYTGIPRMSAIPVNVERYPETVPS